MPTGVQDAPQTSRDSEVPFLVLLATFVVSSCIWILLILIIISISCPITTSFPSIGVPSRAVP